MHPDLTLFRRALHRIPELDRDLPETAAYIRGVLAPLGCDLRAVGGSLCAFFDAGRPDAVAFRADTDALPITERTGAPYASAHPGKMHACGHDGHTALLLGLAQWLAQNLDALPHNALLLFQCAEETTGGAEALCESGVLEDYNVRAIFGCHLWPGLPLGSVASRPGPIMARSCEIDVRITGKSAHVAHAQEGADALEAGARFLCGAYALDALRGEEPCLLRFGRMRSGTVRNALSAQTLLQGTLRCFSDETLHILRQGLDTLCTQVEAQTGCACAYQLSTGYPPLVNDPALYERVCALLGDNAPIMAAQSMTSEDFSFYARRLPAVFFFLGVGDTPPLHADTFDFDESCLARGLALYQRLMDLDFRE